MMSENMSSLDDAIIDEPESDYSEFVNSGRPSTSKKSKQGNKSAQNTERKGSPKAIHLVNEKEEIQFQDAKSFTSELGCDEHKDVRVISIVGKTGDGKSHTLNHAFFNGQPVFTTSNSQQACTMGVWAAYVPHLDYLLLDTEGLLGNSTNPNQQKRLLLKLFAISDIVIYRTMAERLHSDIFTFLGDASDAFGQHFKQEIDRLLNKSKLQFSATEMGPSVIIFQETKHTETKPETDLISIKNHCKMDDFFSSQFSLVGRNTNSFSILRYIGTRTPLNTTTDFSLLSKTVKSVIDENHSRSSRPIGFVFKVLKDLNASFMTDLPKREACTFVEEYFTCSARCVCCQVRCSLGLGHLNSGRNHEVHSKDGKPVLCVYERSVDNKTYFCSRCTLEGKETMLIPKFLESKDNALTGVMRYLWSGFILECNRHGVVYRSRANWSNNPIPEHTPNIESRIVHCWPGGHSLLKGTHPVGQIVIDGLNNVSTQLGRFAWPHARKLGDLIADSVAPDYWEPNANITNCSVCKRKFAEGCEELRDEPVNSPVEGRKGKNEPISPDQEDDGFKHHCRACGRGVCSLCSTARLPVPERGIQESVRICDNCYNNRVKTDGDRKHTTITASKSSGSLSTGSDTKSPFDPNSAAPFGRRVFETLAITTDYIKPILEAPKGFVKTYARPEYWQPDEECKTCPCCELPFGQRRPVHHCRQCGKGVCNSCSLYRAPIPMRGLDQLSRVCNLCSGVKKTTSMPNSDSNGMPANVGIKEIPNNSQSPSHRTKPSASSSRK